MGVILGAARVGLAIEEQIGVYFYFFLNQVMQRLGVGIQASLLRLVGFVGGGAFILALVH